MISGVRVGALLGALVLAGCGTDSGSDNYGWGWHFDEQGASGLRVRYAPDLPSPRLADIERLYIEVENCIGVTATGPLVILTSQELHAADGTPVYGQTILDTGTAVISAHLTPTIDASWWTYKHEFIHFLLHVDGLPIDQNRAHHSPAFLKCAQPPA